MIVSKIEPIIKLDPLEITGDEKPSNIGAETKLSKQWGSSVPLVVVNDAKLEEDELESFVLDLSGKIPSLSFSIRDITGKFRVHVPMDGDLVKIWLAPPDTENQRGIRCDFDILGIESVPENDYYVFRCILHIPEWWKETSESYPENSLFEVFETLTETTGLGLSSNIDKTDDRMTRIRGYENLNTFLDREVLHGYLDDKSFLDWYIDPFYFLTLVEINQQFIVKGDPIEITISRPPLNAEPTLNQSDANVETGKLLLTNDNTLSGTNVFIESYSVKQRSAEKWIRNGYSRKTVFLEYNDGGKTVEPIVLPIEPLYTEGSETDFILQRSKPNNPKTKELIRWKWMGRQSSNTNDGNSHPNWFWAKTQNLQNFEEINKVSLIIKLAYQNFWLQKWMSIPIEIYEPKENRYTSNKLENRDQETGEAEPNESTGNEFPYVKNRHLSGWYVISSIKWVWQKGGSIKQEIELLRREWPIPAPSVHK